MTSHIGLDESARSSSLPKAYKEIERGRKVDGRKEEYRDRGRSVSV